MPLCSFWRIRADDKTKNGKFSHLAEIARTIQNTHTEEFIICPRLELSVTSADNMNYALADEIHFECEHIPTGN